VGHTTLISGEGKQAVRTGVTAVWPRGKQSLTPSFAGWFSLNGNGEMKRRWRESKLRRRFSFSSISRKPRMPGRWSSRILFNAWVVAST
jgi:hypothetical protein